MYTHLPHTQARLVTFLIVCFLMLPTMMYSQEVTNNPYTRLSTCSYYNAFLSTWHRDSLETKVDTVKNNGTIYFGSKFGSEIGNLNNMNPYLGLNTSYSFQFLRSIRGTLDTNKVYARYQEYYNGLKVEGGGYTVSFYPPGPVGPDCPNCPEPRGPCDRIYAMTAYVLSNININTSPSINLNSVKNILSQDSFYSSELVIASNINGNCQYNLTWTVSYIDSTFKKSWVDAHTGQVLKTIIAIQSIHAPTITYCTQNLHDSQNGATTIMSTPPNHFNNTETDVTAYDFSNLSGGIKFEDYEEFRIPETNQNQWPGGRFDQTVSQSFYVTERAVHEYLEIGINFGDVHVGSFRRFNAFSLPNSTLNETYILIGNGNSYTFALFDVAGHELGHTFLNGFLDYSEIGNASLHEGISDIFGTYIESQIQQNSSNCIENGTDWILGDDNMAIPHRDIAEHICFTDVKDSNDQHERGRAIGHFYYVLSTGGDANNIQGLGMVDALNIIRATLPRISRESDYHDFMLQSLEVVLENFGRCSDEFISVVRAWEHICVPVPAKYKDDNGKVIPCDLQLSGPYFVCGEDEYLKVCFPIEYIDNYPNAIVEWDIDSDKFYQIKIFHQPYEDVIYYWDGNCIKITQLPYYDYYPQYITIGVEYENDEFSVRDEIRVKVIDCDHDDCTCEEYYENPEDCVDGEGLPASNSPKTKELQNIKLNKVSNSPHDQYVEISYVIVYNLMGQELYQGNIDKDYLRNIDYNGVVIICYFNKNGRLINTEKRIILNN